MAIVVPAQLEALNGRELAIVRHAKIKASQIEAIAENTHYALASAARRTAIQSRNIDLTGVTSYTVVHKVRFDFASGREDAGMRGVYKIVNAYVKITIRNSADSADLASTTFSGTTDASFTIAAPGSSAVIIKVEGQRLIAGAASITLLWLYEQEHNASTLPGAA